MQEKIKEISNKKIIIIGGAGFIGSALAKSLVTQNTILSIDNYFTGSDKNHIDGVNYHSCDASSINNFLSFNPDYVIHFGEYSRVEQSFKDFKFVMQNNLGSLPTILNFCSNVGAKLIYSGSSTKFANDVEGKNESPYAFTKAMNTELIKNYSRWFSLKYAIIYFYNVYGPGEISSGRYATVVSKFLKAFKNGETLPVVSPGTQKRNFTHIDDVVSGIKLVTELGEGDGYGIGSDESYTILDLAKLIGGEIRLVPQRKGNRLDSKLITSKTIDLGWEPKKTLKSYIYEKINS